MKVVILQSNYIPWKGYFDLIHDADVFCFYDEVKYTKNDWRNRNRIYTKNGLQWLSIPISKDAVKQKISEVELPSGWQQAHNTSLRLGYGKAPYFKNLTEFLDDFYINKTFGHLSEFNQYSIRRIAEYIGIETRFVNSADYELKGDRVERLVNLLVQMGATEYISGPSAKGYLAGNEHLFEEKGIKITFKEYGAYPPYRQLLNEFENAVSVVDMIANLDRSEIADYIWKWRQADSGK
jgi:hypothetical protein